MYCCYRYYRYCCLLLLFVFQLLISNTSSAQDIQFSQFYANTLYLNPAFAGITPYTRLMFHQRLQWPSLDARYSTSMVAIDHYFEKYKSGLGLIAMHDIQGASNIASTQVDLQYAYEISLSNKFSFRPGLQAGFVSRYIDYSGLVYPDQYNDNGFAGGSQSDHQNNRINFMDFSAGGILYSDGLWMGFSAHHINTPNQSFLGESSRLPAKFSFVGGYKFIVERTDIMRVKHKISIIPTFQYKLQGKSDQFDIGIYGLYYQALLGVWSRGIPIKKYQSKLSNNESLILLAGYKFSVVSVSYSYDLTVSRLIKAGSGGSHELNITYLFQKSRKPRKPMKKLPCPDLYKS